MTGIEVQTLEQAKELVRQKVILALDVSTLEEALQLVESLQGRLRYFKIGHRLFTRYGTSILDACAERGAEIFLDLKLYDIPSVVGDACHQIGTHESVFMTTIHASGGAEMVYAAVEGARQARQDGSLKILAVTALTSFATAELPSVGVSMTVGDWAARLADLALGAGADGLVSSAKELTKLRATYGDEPLLVTPGIRLKNIHIAGDDQHRVDNPRHALELGSSMLVMGRPIYQAPNPQAVIDAVAESLIDG